MNVSPYICDYSESNVNETLLLQSTQTNNRPKNIRNPPPSLFQELKEGETVASRQKSLMFDFFSQLSVTANSNVRPSDGSSEQPHQKIEHLYNICSNLMSTLQKLQCKIQKMEEKESERVSFQRETLATASENEHHSSLAYSSLHQHTPLTTILTPLTTTLTPLNTLTTHTTKKCTCELHPKGSSDLFAPDHWREKMQFSQEENQALKKEIIRLEVLSQEQKKAYKRIETENFKLRELLKQYQSFNKKLITERQTEAKLERNHSSKLVTERQFTHSKTNTCQFPDQNDSSHYSAKGYYQNDYYGDRARGNSSKSRNKDYKAGHQRSALRTKQASTFAEIPRKNPHSYFLEERPDLKSFQQCRKHEPLGSFSHKLNLNAVSQHTHKQGDSTGKAKHPASFYELRQKATDFPPTIKQNQSPLKENSRLTIRQRQRQ